nr:DUF58 domain-containing protein [uncultured Desulfobulbus sp.]
MASILSTPIALKWPLKARQKRLCTRLAPAGWGFFGLIGCGFLLSINFSNNLIFAMTFLLVAVALVGWYFTRVNLAGVVPADWQVEPVFAGQTAVYRLQAENRSRQDRYGLRVAAKGADSEGEHLLARGERAEMVLRRSAKKRGTLPHSAATIRSAFPLGLFEARLRAGELPRCLVYPEPVGAQALPEHLPNRSAHQLKESGSYTDMRRYNPGDPLSRISWQALARFDELYTKEFDGAQGQSALWLRWEDLRVTAVEDRLSQLCRWVLDAHRLGREYGLELPGTRLEPACEEKHLRACLKALALYGLDESEKERAA